MTIPSPFALGTPVVAVLAALQVHVVVAAVAALLGAGVPLANAANVPWRTIVGIATAQPALAAMATGMAKVALFAEPPRWSSAQLLGRARSATPAELSSVGSRAFTAGLVARYSRWRRCGPRWHEAARVSVLAFEDVACVAGGARLLDLIALTVGAGERVGVVAPAGRASRCWRPWRSGWCRHCRAECYCSGPISPIPTRTRCGDDACVAG
ncbi:hypothetical protein AB5I41_12150 [Sphingomonas sp. MMS24-JH45]